MKYILPLLIILFTGCSIHNTGSTYSQEEMGKVSTVSQGTIVSMRKVNIKGTSSIGKTSGATVGALGAGLAASDSRLGAVGTMVSTIVGGIVGSAVGASTEEQLTKTTAYEFLIKDRYGEILSIVQTNEENLKVGEKVLIMDSGKSRIVRLIEE